MKNKLPIIVIFATLLASALILAAILAQAGTNTRVIEITARRYEFSPSEITLKKGQPVTLRLTTQDVKHGFFAKALYLDADITPGKTTEVTLTPQVAGKFVTVCDDFCGVGHDGMLMTIVVE